VTSQRQHQPPHEQHRCLRLDGSGYKVSFRSAAKAKQSIIKHRVPDGVTLRPYQCTRCNYWHLTSRPPFIKEKAA